MNITNELSQTAEQLAHQLAEQQLRIVFAESCTAGLVSATLAQVPGISQWHCGSAVVYRETTKTAWLAIPPAMIEKHNVVSSEIAQLMAAGVLQFTPEADISAAITGHLGPNVPAELDGVVHVAAARRENGAVSLTGSSRFVLEATTRVARQQEASSLLMHHVVTRLAN